LTCCSGVSVGRKRTSEWSQCVFSCEAEGFSLEEEGLENGARVDFQHQKRVIKTPEIHPKSSVQGFQFAGRWAANGASESSVVRLRASVWRKKGLRMELG
jgi:hypothetical protein